MSHLWSNSASHIILCFPIYNEEKKSGISLYIYIFFNPKLAKIGGKNESFVVKFSQSYYFALSDILLKKNWKKLKKIEKIRDFFIYKLFLILKLAQNSRQKWVFFAKSGFISWGTRFLIFVPTIFKICQANLERMIFLI